MAFAAKEAKALEDLNSPIYRDEVTGLHLVPWELRILAVRLLGIGYGDLKRGVWGYYDLARDAREEIGRTTGEEQKLWVERLHDLGVRVGNALIEMGDLVGAARHLKTLRGRNSNDDQVLNGRLALLYLKLGNVAAARTCLESQDGSDGAYASLRPLLSMAEGHYDAAVDEWRALLSTSPSAIATQNLAVCLLYTGRLDEVRLFKPSPFLP